MRDLTKFYEVINRQAAEPHEYGKSDCLCQVSEGVEAITGIDHAAPYRGKYKTYEEAIELLKKDGYKDPEAFIIAKGFRAIPVLDAVDGDIGAVETADGILGYGQFVKATLRVQTERGKGKLPRSSAIKAFRVI